MKKVFAASNVVLALAACSVWVIGPAMNWKTGTADNINAAVISEPFIASPYLKYTWSGDIVRSCDIVLDRYMIDSQGVVWELKSSPLLPAGGLGSVSFDLSVETPDGLASGPAVYQVTERPRCDWLQSIITPRVDYPPVYFTVNREGAK